MAMGAVALMVAMAAFVGVGMSDNSDAAVTYNHEASFSVYAGNSFSESCDVNYTGGSTSTENMPSWVSFSQGSGKHTVSGTAPSEAGTYTFTTTNTYRSGTIQKNDTVTWTINVIANNSFTLNFDANGGTSGLASQSYSGSESTHSFTIPSDVPVRDGYTFAGWATSSGGSVAYAPGATVTMSPGSMTLYAVWNVNWNVSDMTAYAGQAISITPVASGTVSVSGVSWLSASGNCVYGTAPSENGTYDVTVSCDGQSSSFRITVISALAFSSVPSSGIFAYEG